MVLVATVSGCSLALSTPDPLRAAHVAPRCDTGKGLVTLDWVLAGAMATIALSALSEDAGELAAASALTSAAFIASAARGNGVVNKCRQEFAVYSEYAPPVRNPEEVARRPRTPVETRAPRTSEDPYASPADMPARRIVAPPPVPARAPQPAPATAKPTSAPAPAPSPAPAAGDDWSDFWTELP